MTEEVSAKEASGCPRHEKQEQEKVAMIGVEERLSGGMIGFPGELLHNRLVHPLPSFISGEGGEGSEREQSYERSRNDRLSHGALPFKTAVRSSGRRARTNR